MNSAKGIVMVNAFIPSSRESKKVWHLAPDPTGLERPCCVVCEEPKRKQSMYACPSCSGLTCYGCRTNAMGMTLCQDCVEEG